MPISQEIVKWLLYICILAYNTVVKNNVSDLFVQIWKDYDTLLSKKKIKSQNNF